MQNYPILFFLNIYFLGGIEIVLVIEFYKKWAAYKDHKIKNKLYRGVAGNLVAFGCIIAFELN